MVFYKPVKVIVNILGLVEVIFNIVVGYYNILRSIVNN